MATATHMGRPGLIDYTLLAFLAAVWGGSFMLIKVALGDYTPVEMTFYRLVIGALALLAVAIVLGERFRFSRSEVLMIALIGFFGNALPFTLISWGEESVDAGLASILMGIMPIATLVLAHFFSEGEPLTKRKFVGVLIGFAGLVLLTGPTVLRNLGGEGVRQLAILAAAISYGINAIITKRIVHLPRRIAGASILLAGMAMMLPLMILSGSSFAVSGNFAPTFAVIILGLFPTGLAALLVFIVLDRQGAGFFGQVNLLVPPAGVLWAAVVLGERPGVAALAAMGFILAGILIARSGSSPALLTPSNRIQPLKVTEK